MKKIVALSAMLISISFFIVGSMIVMLLSYSSIQIDAFEFIAGFMLIFSLPSFFIVLYLLIKNSKEE